MDLDFDQYKAQQFCDNLDCDDYGNIGEAKVERHFIRILSITCVEVSERFSIRTL